MNTSPNPAPTNTSLRELDGYWWNKWRPIFANGIIPREFQDAIEALLTAKTTEARIDELQIFSAYTPDGSEWAYEHIEARLSELQHPTKEGK